jgi:hypothetical protein
MSWIDKLKSKQRETEIEHFNDQSDNWCQLRKMLNPESVGHERIQHDEKANFSLLLLWLNLLPLQKGPMLRNIALPSFGLYLLLIEHLNGVVPSHACKSRKISFEA